jgi:hypothetical protein
MTPGRGARGGDHESYDELAVGWALHALEPEDEALFGLHLPDCARCARTLAETSEVMAALAADLPPAEPSAGLRERIRSAVGETEQVRSPVLPSVSPVAMLDDGAPPRPPAGPPAARPRAPATWGPRRLRPGGWGGRTPQALAAGATAVVIGLGVWNVVLSTARQQAEQTAAEQQRVVDSLLTPGRVTFVPLDSEGHRVATVVARQGRLEVVTTGLPVDEELSTTYVLWGLRRGAAVPLGTFDVIRPRLDLRTVGSDGAGPGGFSGYEISLEPGRKAPAKPTRVVARGQVTQ